MSALRTHAPRLVIGRRYELVIVRLSFLDNKWNICLIKGVESNWFGIDERNTDENS